MKYDRWTQSQTMRAVLWAAAACWFLVQVSHDALKPVSTSALPSVRHSCVLPGHLLFFFFFKAGSCLFQLFVNKRSQIRQGITVKRHEKILAGWGRGKTSGGSYMHCLNLHWILAIFHLRKCSLRRVKGPSQVTELKKIYLYYGAI